jgi:RNA polymerase sigma-70 factor, ECF subfamily
MTEKERTLLILRAQTGDKSALNDLLKLIQQPLFYYIYNVLFNKTYASDILQEVFILIYKKLPGLNHPEYFNSWVYRIASREIFRFIKKNKKQYEYPVDNEELDNYISRESNEHEEDILKDKIEMLIKYLPPASRAVITLHYKNEMSLSEVADVLDTSTGTVKSRLAYGLKLLRDKIALHPELKETMSNY